MGNIKQLRGYGLIICKNRLNHCRISKKYDDFLEKKVKKYG